MEERASGADKVRDLEEQSHPIPTKFRFKSKPRSADEDSFHESRSDRYRVKKRRKNRASDPYHDSQRRHESSSRRHRPSRQRSETEEPRSPTTPYIDPDTAFRESLFDALADDEGAAYWEGVYGQPIHTYPNTRPGPEGELEQMTDEEYATYVRARMYEKTHQYVFEERERRQQARQRAKEVEEQTRKLEEERQAFRKDIEESLRRGEARRNAKKWKEAWEAYVAGWEGLKDVQPGLKTPTPIRDIFPWPVMSGKWRDVSKEGIESFFKSALPREARLSSVLKAERVRWHPDKVQQRFGDSGVDSDMMKLVTAVFQVIDRLWNEIKAGHDR